MGAQYVIFVNYSAGLILATGLNHGLSDNVFGALLVLVNLSLVGFILVAAARRQWRAEVEKQWRQPLTVEQFAIVDAVMRGHTLTRIAYQKRMHSLNISELTIRSPQKCCYLS